MAALRQLSAIAGDTATIGKTARVTATRAMRTTATTAKESVTMAAFGRYDPAFWGSGPTG